MRAVCSKSLLTKTHPQFFGWLWPRVCALVIASGLHGLAVPTANAQASSDLLSGQRLIFENDDVWIIGSSQQPPGAGITVTVGETSGSNVTGFTDPNGCGSSDQLDSVADPTAAKGRMFNQASDSVAVVTTTPNRIFVCVGQGSGGAAVPTLGPVSTPGAGMIGGVAMAHFGGSFEQLFIKWYVPNNDYLAIVYPVDPNNPGAGLRITPWVQAGPSSPGVAVGNFDGNTNGIVQVARAQSDSSDKLYVYYDTVDPKTLAITPGAQMSIGVNTGRRVPLSGLSIAAGHFLANPASSQLVITYMSLRGEFATGQTEAVLVDLVSGAPTVKYHIPIPPALDFAVAGDSFIKAGSLDASGTDQAVIFALLPEANTASIVDFSTAPPTPPSVVQTQVPCCLGDFVVGRFDPPPLAPNQPNLDFQVALVSPGSPPTIIIYNTVGADGQFAWRQHSSFSLSGITLNNLAAVAADYQGRSLVVGEPTITTIQGHDQPEIVLGMPPMHVDFAHPNNSSRDCVQGTHTTQYDPKGQCVVNVSFAPDGKYNYVPFNSMLNFSSSSSTSQTQQSTTSYSFSVAATAEEKIAYSAADDGIGGSISADFKEGLKNAWMTNTQKTFNTYSAVSKSVSSTTGNTDSLFYITNDTNILNYPVIGRYACPKGMPNCQPSQEQPLYIELSQPVNPQLSYGVAASLQQWFQPPQEAGEVFSYPCDLPELLATNPGLMNLTTPESWFQTGSNGNIYKNTWTANSGTSQTSGTTNSHSLDLSQSVSSSISVGGFSGSASFKIEENTSTSYGTVNTDTQTLDASTGIAVSVPNFAADNHLAPPSHYAYWFGGYVLGLNDPDVLQDFDLSTGFQSQGPLVASFVANPLRPNQSQTSWWSSNYGSPSHPTQPDVALNHPLRWNWDPVGEIATFNQSCTGPMPPPNCTVAGDSFYWMKGFFITPADAEGNGPQLTTTIDGDQLQLSARIYNYSLTAMPAGSAVHVRFYRQQWNGSKLVANTAKLVGETTQLNAAGDNPLTQVPPFPGNSCSSDTEFPSAPNWAIASVPFDTTGLSANGGNWVFWVLVWIEKSGGGLASEMPGHGLTQDPLTMTFNDVTQVPIEAYSNNLGVYGVTAGANGALVINPPGTAPLPSLSQPGAVSFTQSPASAAPPQIGRTSLVSAALEAGSADVGPNHVYFYDGDPTQGGKLFDVIRVEKIRGGKAVTPRALFQPLTCGPHNIVAVAAPNTPAATSAATNITVTINPISTIQNLITNTKILRLPEGTEKSLLAKLDAALRAFVGGHDDVAADHLRAFINEVEAQNGNKIPAQGAALLAGEAGLVLSCPHEG